MAPSVSVDWVSFVSHGERCQYDLFSLRFSVFSQGVLCLLLALFGYLYSISWFLWLRSFGGVCRYESFPPWSVRIGQASSHGGFAW